MATNRATIKKTPLSAFKNARLRGIIATILDEGETLVGVGITDGHSDIMIFSDAGKCVRFDESIVRSMSRMAHGVRGMRLEGDQSLIALIVINDDTKYVLTATENGYGKRTPVKEYPRHGRGGKGVIAISTSARNGRLVSAVLTQTEDEIMLLTTGGKVVRTRAGEVSVLSRGAQGVRLINPGEDLLASVRRVAVTSDEDELESLQIEASEEDLMCMEADPVDEPEVLDDEDTEDTTTDLDQE